MEVIRELRDQLVRRLRIFSVAVVSLLVAIATGFWFVQGVHGSFYRELAESNRLRRLPVHAPRGLIYDRNGRLLVENIPSYDLLLDRGRVSNRTSSLAFAADILGQPTEELAARLGRFDDVPAFQPVRLAERLSLAEVARFSIATLEHPELEIDVEHLRLYRHGPQTSHVLGYLGEVDERELAQHPDRYSAGDLVGKRGIEETFDLDLRGREGQRVVVVDSRGRVLEELGREPSETGRDLTLSIDLELQQEAERQLRGRVGAVVALDPRNGEVLALYSSPAYNSNPFARGLTSQEWKDLLAAPHNPLQNRALQNTHPPGSVFKVVMAVAGLSEKVITTGDRVYCPGFTTIYNHRFHCGKRSGHGWVNLEEAIERSCNIYFYQLGQKLGLERIAHYAELFGLGRATGIQLRGEKSGLVPSEQWSLATRGSPWFPGETISLAVGQGALLVTPLQVARMMAVVANGGRLVQPTLLPGNTIAPGQALAIPPAILEAVRRGLEAVVNEPGGTAYWTARLPKIAIAGKTGTAQVVASRASRPAEDLPFEERTHAWFASFAPARDPRLVVVVFVEHGGSGSAAAAPIAKALYATYFKSVEDLPESELGHSGAG
jgi:penicillin-binding protein 2